MLKFKENNSLPEYFNINDILDELTKYYPDIKNWFWDKVVPSIELGNSKMITMENDEDFIGLSIIKDTEFEKKIRTLYISEKYRNSGNIFKLFKKSIEILGDEKPLYTVSEDFINFYKKTAKKYNHEITGVLIGKYREGVKEYIFNKKDDYSTPFEEYGDKLNNEELKDIKKYFDKGEK